VTLVYSSARAHPFPLLPTHVTVPVRAAVPPLVSYTVKAGGVQHGARTYIDTSGLSENIDETFRVVAGFDASQLQTGVVPIEVRISSEYGDSRVSSVQTPDVLVVNEAGSSIGAGFSVSGVERLVIEASGNALLVDGDGGMRLFR